ncbi:DUF3164 family protein [Brenneria goodwinii]|nr:DUF3164 family protein [Brenneria goodwinii]
MNKETIPAGYRLNSLGHLVPEDLIKPIDKLRDDVVLNIVNKAKEQRKAMAEFKIESMAEIADFVDLSASEYGVEYGGAKGNVLLSSFDGHYQVRRAVGDHRVFDERIQAAKKILDDLVIRWGADADPKIKAIINHAFRVNKQGRIDVNQVLSLRQIDIDDPEWQSAMSAIADSIQVSGTSQYLRIYERKQDGQYQQINLDIAKV